MSVDPFKCNCKYNTGIGQGSHNPECRSLYAMMSDIKAYGYEWLNLMESVCPLKSITSFDIEDLEISCEVSTEVISGTEDISQLVAEWEWAFPINLDKRSHREAPNGNEYSDKPECECGYYCDKCNYSKPDCTKCAKLKAENKIKGWNPVCDSCSGYNISIPEDVDTQIPKHFALDLNGGITQRDLAIMLMYMKGSKFDWWYELLCDVTFRKEDNKVYMCCGFDHGS